ncbi:alpha-glycosidase [Priestia taiwanensis]|uniref:Alpha-glycosidase n=1 Tax=Priestia taiwanensis TaxID=1347902 RepID=A0A917AT77_9BACI|nr:alpha-glycosidase [Priestia taiwanensis]MBM7364197.1 glycosidase [Priestia taiwanensis]GGE72431.1 alpha-glycosidase [Priestia taiwanensis]
MQKEAVYHSPTYPFVYAVDEHTVHIRLRTKKQDVQAVTLLYGDQYEWCDGAWITSTIAMQKTGYNELFDYWFVTVQPPYGRLRYAFSLQSEESLYYMEKGFFIHAPTHDVSAFFCFPFVHTCDMFQAPSWTKDTVWYQIFPERFCDGDSTNNPVGTIAWESMPPTPTSFYGGDLDGIIEKLDYLYELGINGIYLTPIFNAHSNHKYDTIDYFTIDEAFGNKEILKKLVSHCHEKGIKVMLDAVFNHAGYFFDKWQDVLKNQEQSAYKDWFHIHSFPVRTGPVPTYATFAFEKTMPKLNTNHPEVKEYLLRVGRYWIEEANIDGWRLDVANEVSHQFWREFRLEMTKVKPSIFIVGEVWHNALPWLHGDQFHSVMNYPFTNICLAYFIHGTCSTEQFIFQLHELLFLYPTHVTDVLFNIVGSHDTPRILTLAKEHVAKVKLLLVFLFSYPGSPCIYYGDEIGMLGDNDPDNRRCMVWDEARQNKEIYTHIQTLIKLRKTFRNETTFQLLEKKDCLVYKKECNEEALFFILNNSASPQTVVLPYTKGTKITNMYTDEEMAYESSSISLVLEAYDFAILHM